MSLGSEPATAIVEESYTAQTAAHVTTAVNIAPITFLQVSLRSFCTDLHVSGSLAAIGDRTWPHAPPRFSVSKLMHHMRRHQLQADVTRDVISAMSILAYVSIQSSADVNAMSSLLNIDHIDFDH